MAWKNPGKPSPVTKKNVNTWSILFLLFFYLRHCLKQYTVSFRKVTVPFSIYFIDLITLLLWREYKLLRTPISSHILLSLQKHSLKAACPRHSQGESEDQPAVPPSHSQVLFLGSWLKLPKSVGGDQGAEGTNKGIIELIVLLSQQLVTSCLVLPSQAMCSAFKGKA